MVIAIAASMERHRIARATPETAADADLRRDARWLLPAGLAISVAIVAGMFLESGTLMGVAAFAAFGAGIVNPALGLIVLAFMGPLRPPPTVPAPGFDIILVGAILLGCIYRLPFSRNRVTLSPALILLGAFVLYAFVQQLPDMATGYAGTRSHDVGFLFYQMLTGFGTVLAAGFVLRGRSPYPFLVALLLSATLAALLGIVTADGLPYARLANLMPPSDVASRATGPFGNPNSFGQLLAYATALAVAWFVATTSRRAKAGLLAVAGIMGIGLALSLSRGAAATLLAGLVALAFARGRALGAAALAGALVLVFVGYPLVVDWRLTAEAGSASSAAAAQLAASDEGRLGAILAGPALFATSPIFGIGFGQYKYASALVTDQGAGLVAHNWYGTVLAEQGLLGIALWVLVLVAVALWLRTRPSRPRSVGLAMLGVVTVGCLFLEPPTSFQTSVLPAIVLTGALVGDWSLVGAIACAEVRDAPERPCSSRPGGDGPTSHLSVRSRVGRDGRASASGALRVALLAPSLHPGGAERQMLLLAAAMPRATFDLRFLVLSEPGDLAAEAAALGVPVHVLGLRRDACRSITPRCLGDARRALVAYRRLTRDVDIVDAWLVPAYTFAGLAQLVARVPVLIAGRRSTFDVERTRTWYREAAGRLAMHGVGAIVANSQAAANDAIAFERIDPARIHVIRNAVVPFATTDAERAGLRSAWGFSPNDVVVGCVANYKPGKGHRALLEVAGDLRDRFPQLRYCFVGDGPLRAELEGEVRRRGLGHLVTLHSGERDARRLYGAFDIAVQASDSEGLPNVVLEAAAAGLPIVATAVGGTPEILTGGVDGLLVPRGDRPGLARAITALAEAPELRQRLGRAARARAEDFSPTRLAAETGELYQRLAHRL